jgi:hypothetical protein
MQQILLNTAKVQGVLQRAVKIITDAQKLEVDVPESLRDKAAHIADLNNILSGLKEHILVHEQDIERLRSLIQRNEGFDADELEQAMAQSMKEFEEAQRQAFETLRYPKSVGRRRESMFEGAPKRAREEKEEISDSDLQEIILKKERSRGFLTWNEFSRQTCSKNNCRCCGHYTIYLAKRILPEYSEFSSKNINLSTLKRMHRELVFALHPDKSGKDERQDESRQEKIRRQIYFKELRNCNICTEVEEEEAVRQGEGPFQSQ